MIDALIALIVICIVGGLLYWLVLMLPLPAPFKMVIQVAAVLILILLILGVFFGGIAMPHFAR